MGNRLIDVAICALFFIVTFTVCIWIIVTESVIVRFLTIIILLIVWASFVLYTVKLVSTEDKDEDK